MMSDAQQLSTYAAAIRDLRARLNNGWVTYGPSDDIEDGMMRMHSSGVMVHRDPIIAILDDLQRKISA